MPPPCSWRHLLVAQLVGEVSLIILTPYRLWYFLNVPKMSHAPCMFLETQMDPKLQLSWAITVNGTSVKDIFERYRRISADSLLSLPRPCSKVPKLYHPSQDRPRRTCPRESRARRFAAYLGLRDEVDVCWWTSQTTGMTQIELKKFRWAQMEVRFALNLEVFRNYAPKNNQAPWPFLKSEWT